MECPHCKQPSTMKRKAFCELFEQWECERCGSTLALNTTRDIILAVSLYAVFLALYCYFEPYLKIPSRMALPSMIFGLLATQPLRRLIGRRLGKLVVIRRKGVYCPACGYDLRANESGQCPECGKPHPLAKAVQK